MRAEYTIWQNELRKYKLFDEEKINLTEVWELYYRGEDQLRSISSIITTLNLEAMGKTDAIETVYELRDSHRVKIRYTKDIAIFILFVRILDHNFSFFMTQTMIKEVLDLPSLNETTDDIADQFASLKIKEKGGEAVSLELIVSVNNQK